MLIYLKCILFSPGVLFIKPMLYFPTFSALSKYGVPMEYNIYTWQVSQELSCAEMFNMNVVEMI